MVFMENKNKKIITIIVSICLVLIVGITATYICLADDKESGNKTIETSDVVAATEDEMTTEEMAAESLAEKEEPASEQSEDKPEAEKEEKPQTVTGTTQATQTTDNDEKETASSESNTAQGADTTYTETSEAVIPDNTEAPAPTETDDTPATTEATTEVTTEAEKVWVEAVYEEVWVVDQEAYTYENPVYETRAKDVCNGCGADVTENPDAHFKAQIAAGNTSCGGYHIEYYQVQVGTETIEVPEEGHWETICISEGYWM